MIFPGATSQRSARSRIHSSRSTSREESFFQGSGFTRKIGFPPRCSVFRNVTDEFDPSDQHGIQYLWWFVGGIFVDDVSTHHHTGEIFVRHRVLRAIDHNEIEGAKG